MKPLNERGYALYITLLTIVLISVIFISLMTINTNANKTTVNGRTDQSLYYIAEAGINLEKAKILQSVEQIYNTFKSQINSISNYEEQEKFLAPYGGLNGYYSHLIENTYCTTYNSNVAIQGKCFNKTYSNSFTLDDQLTKTPVSKTTVTYDCVTSNCMFSISAEGTFLDESKSRKLEQRLVVELPNFNNNLPNNPNPGEENNSQNSTLNEFASFVKGDININRGGKIYGHVGLLNGSLYIDKSQFTLSGNVSISDQNNIICNECGNYKDPLITTQSKKVDPINLDIDDLLPEYPINESIRLAQLSPPSNLEVAVSQWNKTNIIDNGNFLANNWMTTDYIYNINNDTRFKKFEVTTNISLDIGSNNVNLYVDDFAVTNSGSIKIIGSGTLNIFVKNKLDFSNSATITQQPNNNPMQLNLNYEGNTPITLAGNTKISGSYYSKQADLTLDGSAGFLGNIYSGGKNITIKGDSSQEAQYLVAPNADIKIDGSGKIKGTVIVNSVNITGGGTITFGAPIIPLPTIPNTPPITIPSISEYLKEKPLTEV